MTTIRELLDVGQADAPAIIVPGGRTLSYADLRKQVDSLAGQLHTLGIGRNDRVAIVLPNGPAMAIMFLTVAGCATAAPLNPAYREEEFRFYLDDLGAAALVTLPNDMPAAHAAAPASAMRLSLVGEPGSYSLQKDGVDVAASAPVYAPENDVALVLHTSGTTARPKIVPLTQLNMTTSAGNIKNALA